MKRIFFFIAPFFIFISCASSQTDQLRAHPPKRGEGVEERADNALRDGDVATAAKRYEVALQQYRRLDDQRGIAGVFLKLGNTMALWGDAQRADDYFVSAGRIAGREGFKDTAAGAGISLALSAMGRGEFAAAEKHLLGVPARDAVEWKLENAWGRLALAKGDTAESKKRFERALEMAKAAKSPAGQSACMTNLGAVYLKTGEREKAVNVLKLVLELNKEAADALAIADVLHMIGEGYEAGSDYEAALYYYRRALSINLLSGIKRRTAADIAAIARVEKFLADLSTAHPAAKP